MHVQADLVSVAARRSKVMRTLYHEFESLEHLLSQRLLPGGSRRPVRFVIFGGTGAVGGAAVMELCRLILMSKRLRELPFRGEIYATGMADKEVAKFVSRLYLALGDEHGIEKIEPLRHYRVGDCIDLRFGLVRLDLPQDLPDHVESERQRLGDTFDIEAALAQYFREQHCPFLQFVEALGEDLLHAVVVSIPLPSVATYTLVAIDRLTDKYQLDHPTKQRIKKSYLKTFVRGLAVIQQRHARHVVMAHTTAVGGMYRVDGGQAEIRLGFAHSALGKKLVDKKYFADELTQLYIDQGFDVLVTAAAIGIDSVEFNCRLPSDRAVKAALQARLRQAEHSQIHPGDLDDPSILLYPSHNVPLIFPSVEEMMAEAREAAEFSERAEASEKVEVDAESPEAGDFGEDDDPPTREVPPPEPVDPDPPLEFGAGKELMVPAAIRSGENGLFSVANCVALYNVMKVAIAEELAMVLVRHALFGPERRREWFRDKICYYTETENSYFALRLLDNYPELVRAHHGAFQIQAYQALGSATHQARLHEMGILLLVLRLRELGESFERFTEDELNDALVDMDRFFWRHTRRPCFEDLEGLDAAQLGELMADLCEMSTMEDAGRFLGFDAKQKGLREPGREKFLARLATRVGRYLQTITSLGIPILYRRQDGEDRMLLGPYLAPFDRAVAHSRDVERLIAERAESKGVEEEVLRRWTIANNGFVDLRPHALCTSAKEVGSDLEEKVHAFSSGEEVLEWMVRLRGGSYFTTCGLVALEVRLQRLYEQISSRKIQLGTYETWKHLFQQDLEGRFILSPGLVETVRMYSEGLGKVTGTEALWPEWGY